jgi:hypothetical protein
MDMHEVQARFLPPSAIGFLRAHVDHIVKLRFLLLLHEAPSSTISVGIGARSLDVPRRQVRDMAHELADDGIVRVSNDEIELAPSSIEDRLSIAEIASWYARDRGVVLEVLRGLGRYE